jgi:primosomal protein N' (replication factor Y)
VQGEDEVKARRQAEEIAAALRVRLPEGAAVGPFAAPVARINDIYRLHILIKTTDRTAAQAALRELGLEKRSDVAIDVDPVNVM